MQYLLVPFAILTGCLWAAAFFDGLVTKDFTALGIVTPVMLVVAGFMFARKNGNGR